MIELNRLVNRHCCTVASLSAFLEEKNTGFGGETRVFHMCVLYTSLNMENKGEKFKRRSRRA